nr:ATP-binding protein [Corynebacterium mendelii]
MDTVSRRVRGTKQAKTLADNRVSTIGQILHLAVQGSPAGVTVVTRNGAVILSNAKAHEMGIVHERAVTEHVWDNVLGVFDDHEPRTISLPGPAKRHGSRVMAVSADIKPLTLVDPRFVIIYSSDESENVRMESARRDFVANVSHELKTPVGGMALLAEALLEAADDPEHVTYFGTKLNKEANRLADMINELISLSKLQGAERLPDMQPVGIDRVIDEAIVRNQLAADQADITLTRDENTGTTVMGDEGLLITAVSNLVGNAVNYSPTGTTVSITQAHNPPDTGKRGGSVSIRVTDRGIGIAPEDQKRVFERFFRVDKARSRSTGGTGLGLAIVKHVAGNHGGSIALWSRPGTGSTFTLTLPLPDPDGGTGDTITDSAAPELAEPIMLKDPAPVMRRTEKG